MDPSTPCTVQAEPEAGEGTEDEVPLGSEDPQAPESSEEAADAEQGEASGSGESGQGGAASSERSDNELVRAISALVFASPEPLTAARLSKLLDKPKPARLRAAMAEVTRRLENSGLPLELREIAGGWLLMTTPDMGSTLARLSETRKVERISAAALETLAVVAYRQPVTKAEIEAIRGVQAGPILRTLVDRGLIHVTGRADQPGHPLQYGTTREFLDRFGLARVEDLPRDGELTRD